jgi:predicted PurR-regulated permease PerM
MSKTRISLNRASVLTLVVLVSLIFYWMVDGFLIAIVMAALFSALLQGWYSWFRKLTLGRRMLASGLTILAFLLIIVIPLGFFTFLLVEQAISAGKTFEPYLDGSMETPELIVAKWLEAIPYIAQFLPEEERLVETIHNVVRNLGNFVVEGLSKATTGTVSFIFQLFIMLFTMFYFIISGEDYLKKILYYIPLSNEQEALLLDKFVRVTRATLKGTLIIGAVQGTIGGVAMWVAGVSNTLFWGVIMAVLSIIPALGPAIVWLPAGLILIVQGNIAAGAGLIAFGVIVVGNIDNLIRPSLVGKDAQLPDLMILFSTLGGLALFGVTGFILGPVIAALFMTSWEIYGNAFQDSLEKVTLFQEDLIGESKPGEETPEVET